MHNLTKISYFLGIVEALTDTNQLYIQDVKKILRNDNRIWGNVVNHGH